MRRSLITVLLLFLLAFGACRQTKSSGRQADGKILVTSVIFPSYDFVRVIAGDKINDRIKLVMLLPPGTESHSYEPSPRDIITIRESDLFIYPGGENTKWVDRILDSIKTPESKMKIIKMMDLVETVKEEIVEGMEEDDDDTWPSYDEHVWTSPKNAKLIAASIAESLCNLDNANAEYYRQNASDYALRLDELDASFRFIVDNAKRKTIVFGDRFPFRYLADAYGLNYFAAFPGCASETEPSAATLAFLINKVKTEQIPVVFHIELSNEKLADTISEAAGARKLLLHSCHNVTRKDFENGVNYLDLQRQNAEFLREALW